MEIGSWYVLAFAYMMTHLWDAQKYVLTRKGSSKFGEVYSNEREKLILLHGYTRRKAHLHAV